MTTAGACAYGLVVGLAVAVFAALWLRVLFPESIDASTPKGAFVVIVILASSVAAGVYVARTRMKKQDKQ